MPRNEEASPREMITAGLLLLAVVCLAGFQMSTWTEPETIHEAKWYGVGFAFYLLLMSGASVLALLFIVVGIRDWRTAREVRRLKQKEWDSIRQASAATDEAMQSLDKAAREYDK